MKSEDITESFKKSHGGLPGHDELFMVEDLLHYSFLFKYDRNFEVWVGQSADQSIDAVCQRVCKSTVHSERVFRNCKKTRRCRFALIIDKHRFASESGMDNYRRALETRIHRIRANGKVFHQLLKTITDSPTSILFEKMKQ